MWYVSALEARENRLSGTRKGRGRRKEHGDKVTFKKKLDSHRGKPTAVILGKHSKEEKHVHSTSGLRVLTRF